MQKREKEDEGNREGRKQSSVPGRAVETHVRWMIPVDMGPSLFSLHWQNGVSKVGTLRDAFVYGNPKGELMNMARGPLSSFSGGSHSQEPFPLQEPSRT